MGEVDVTIFYLEMTSPAQLRPRLSECEGFGVKRAPRDPAINRRFYGDVGADWRWVDRLSWPVARWRAHSKRVELSTYIGYLDNEPVGYFELDQHASSGVEIAYFGLLPAFIGRGLGGVLLTEAVRIAWQQSPPRVWLHTCTLDHPAALANYQARGFVIYKTEAGRQPVV